MQRHTTQCGRQRKPGEGHAGVRSRVSLPNSEILCLTRTPSLQNRLKIKEKQKREGEGKGSRKDREIKIKERKKKEK